MTRGRRAGGLLVSGILFVGSRDRKEEFESWMSSVLFQLKQRM